MKYTSRRYTVNFTNEDGFNDREAIKGIAGMLGAVEVGCGVDVETGTDYAEIIRLREDNWLVVFKNVGKSLDSAEYGNAEKAAEAIYFGKHL